LKLKPVSGINHTHYHNALQHNVSQHNNDQKKLRPFRSSPPLLRGFQRLKKTANGPAIGLGAAIAEIQPPRGEFVSGEFKRTVSRIVLEGFWRRRRFPMLIAPLQVLSYCVIEGRPLGLIGELDKVVGDPALGDKVHPGEEEEGLVRCTMVGALRMPIPTSIGPEVSKHLKVFLKHRSERAPPVFICFCSSLMPD
jgi:hypothetical protein